VDFNGPAVEFSNFQHQFETLLRDRELMLQVAFDIFDSNNDDKVSELDIFKVFYQFSQSSQTDEFQHVFYNDICQMSK